MTRILALLLIASSLVPASASALEWCVFSTNTTRTSPPPQPDGRVVGGGYHVLTIVDEKGWDLVTKFRVTAGNLALNAGVMDKCSSGWIYPHGPEDIRAVCFSRAEVTPCYLGEGVWDTWTVGELQGIPGGSKASTPKALPIACFC